MRTSLLVLALIAALSSVVAASPQPAEAGDNAAVAINLRDGSSTFRLAFKITRVNRDVVDSSNAAVAAASCTDCQTVAVALQAVLIFSDASVITPTNFAFAYNLDCERCYTLATAYQFVSTTGIVRFTADGNRRIAEIHRQLQALRSADLSIEEIQARVDVLAGQLFDVMRSEIVSPGPAEATVTAQGEAGAAPANGTATTTEAALPAPTVDEPTPVEQTVEAPAEQTAGTATDTSGNDPTASGSDPTASGSDPTASGDSPASDTDSSQTTADTTIEPTSDPTAEPTTQTSTP
jgi:putative peptide zinc metalloprotease protein